MGDNAQGKTNLLEAIYLLATGTSFRTNEDRSLLKYDKEVFLVKSTHLYDNKTVNTEVQYQLNKAKVYRINTKKTSHNNPNRLRVVIFTPDDLYLVKGSPHKRRKYIDSILKEISTDYRWLLDKYNKILKKRNELLKASPIDDRNYKIINDIFIEYSAQIISSRIKLINLLDSLINKKNAGLKEEIRYIKLKYALSFPVAYEKINLKTLVDSLNTFIKENKEKEFKKKNSIVGPHLDDLNIYFDDKSARHFASQGQQRNIAVSLKLAELGVYKELCGYYPIFLMDEILAELDEARRFTLMQIISEAEFQCFLTSVTNHKLVNCKGITSIIKKGEILKAGGS